MTMNTVILLCLCVLTVLKQFSYINSKLLRVKIEVQRKFAQNHKDRNNGIKNS